MKQRINYYTNLIRRCMTSLSVILTIFGIFTKNPYAFLFSTTIIILSNVIMSLEDIKDHVIFLLFNVTFTVFLMSRFIASGIFGADFEYSGMFEMSFTKDVTVNIIYFINLSIIALTLAYKYFYSKDKEDVKTESFVVGIIDSIIVFFKKSIKSLLPKKNKVTKTKSKNKFVLYIKENREEIKKYIAIISFTIFIVSVLVKIYTSFEDAKLISKVGYRESFLIDKTSVPITKRIMDIVGRMYFTSFMIFIATKPKLKYVIALSVIFIIPSVFRLKSGARNDIMLDFFILFVYFVYRIENKTIINRILTVAVILAPILIIILMLVEGSRGTLNEAQKQGSGIIDKLLKFLYNQGVSARVIGNAQEFSGQIPHKCYSLGEIIDFVKYSVVGKIMRFAEPQGQSYEVFLGKSQLSHALTFIQSPYEYLNKGLGTGSSYIAELYIDLGIFGIVAGSAFYGYFINKLRKMFFSTKTYVVAIMLIMTRNLFFVPRSSYTFFLNRLLQETQIMIFIFIFISSILLSYIAKKKKYK
ncbi:O-antigen polysaccharide polymerase Wzy family protein [Helcococcus kunzii]|uniref:O-antigen polysaccharide polymerase Wzy family protein n=1 Tax=Helcococcus kunzii TaxID=40091 RepID=UPI001BAEF9C7|nr:O-antigen polysaccharide polymerase Wzy family protein [Helcococcus kunzii]QUY64030.1 O-antigen polysaccharide polymerase Wzy [Helcococcus kunzii]